MAKKRVVGPELKRAWTDDDGRRIEDFVIQGEEPIPFVVMSDGKPGRKPVAFWQHGATGSRLANLEIMHLLCDAGYLHVSVDQRHHGDRVAKMPPLACGEAPLFADNIIWIACGTARDIPLVLDYLETRADTDADRIAWTGGSLGGLVGTILVTREKRIKALVSQISGGWHRMLASVWCRDRDDGAPIHAETDRLLDEFDPVGRVDKLFPTAILQLNGADDNLCPAEGAHAFHNAALPYYESDPERLKLVVYPDVGHAILPESQQAALEWLERYL